MDQTNPELTDTDVCHDRARVLTCGTLYTEACFLQFSQRRKSVVLCSQSLLPLLPSAEIQNIHIIKQTAAKQPFQIHANTHLCSIFRKPDFTFSNDLLQLQKKHFKKQLEKLKYVLHYIISNVKIQHTSNECLLLNTRNYNTTCSVSVLT